MIHFIATAHFSSGSKLSLMRESKPCLYCNDRRLCNIKVFEITLHYKEVIPKCEKMWLYSHPMLGMIFSEAQVSLLSSH